MARYKIFEELGAGGAGQVFKGYDLELERYVAMKRLLTREESDSGSAAAAKLLQEAASLARLRHPNIVSVYGIEEQEDGAFIVMELLEGDDLAGWLLREGPLSLEDFQHLAQQTLEALLAAQSQNILHRDIKPENVKVTRLPGGRFQSKIIDFGLARLSLAAQRQTQDQSGNVLGSVHYMAPEQLRREPLDGRMDLYALGCVFYEALTGTKAFTGPSVREVMDAHLNHQVTLLHDVRGDLPEMLSDWVMWLMAAQPDERPADASMALGSLRQVLKLTSTVSISTVTEGVVLPHEVTQAPGLTHTSVKHPTQAVRMQSSAVPVAAPPRALWPWIVAAVLVLAVGGWYLTRGGSQPQKLEGLVIGSSGSLGDKGDDIDKVFDGKVGTYFDSRTSTGQWAGLSFGVEGSARILRIRFYPRNGFAQRMVGGVFQASSDRDFKTDVKDLYQITTTPPEGWNTVEVDSGDAYRYVRYLSPPNSWGNVAEIEFYGVKG